MIDISVAILSHNHEQTIEKAINGVLSQKLSYCFELILCDDASADNTPNILRHYQEQYPEIVILQLNNERKGPVYRAKQIIETVKGKYLCWLDADDYWTYEYKLQTQVDFLEQHPEFVGCFHDAQIVSDAIYSSSEQSQRQSHHQWKFYSQFNHYETNFMPHQLLARNIIPTASLVFRNVDYSTFFEQYALPVYSFSWAFQLYIIRNSKFYYFNEPWSVYYDHEKGLSKIISKNEFIQNNIRILKWCLRDSFYKQYRHKIYWQIAQEYETLAYGQLFRYTKTGFLMNWYLFKSFVWSWWWYCLRLLKALFFRNRK